MKNLKSISSDVLIYETKTLCAEERRITAEVLLYLTEIESRRLYAELGYGSLFEFAVKELKYSEGAAGRRIAAMRLMRELPEIENGVRSGSLNVTVVSMAKRATEGKSVSEKREVLARLQDQSQKSAETTLATLYPETAQREKERVISSEFTQITFTADQELLEKLTKLRNIFSHRNPDASYQELFHLMADELLKKLDPEKQTSSVTPLRAKRCDTRSRYIPRATKHSIWKEHQGQCSYVDPKSNRRCSSRHLLQIDHVIPFAMGGFTEISNLRLVCRSHNLFLAEKMGLKRPVVNAHK